MRTASCDVFGSRLWCVDRIATGWECQGTTSLSDENIPRINWPINGVPRNISTARSTTLPNQTLTQKEPIWMWKSIQSLPCRGCLVAVFSFGNDPRLVRCCHSRGITVILTMLSSALVPRRHCVMCGTESNISNEKREHFVDFAHTTILDVSVGRRSLSW